MESGREDNHHVHEDDEGDDKPTIVFRPGVDHMDPSDTLVHDPDVYDILHHFDLEWSCLTLDICPPRGEYVAEGALSVQFVAGSQAPPNRSAENTLSVVKCSKISRTWKPPIDDDEDDDDDDDEEDGNDPKPPAIQCSSISSQSGFNTVRICPQIDFLTGAWTDSPAVVVYNIENHLNLLEDKSKRDGISIIFIPSLQF